MSEYWKSTPKYWCKQCSTYVKDTKFERTQHEATAKHQGNLKRALRDIHRGHERDERDKNRAKAEVDRLNRVVSGAPSSAPRSTTEPQLTRKPTTGAPAQKASPEDRKRQVAQLVEMGITIPDEFRAEMAMAGEWKTVPDQHPPSQLQGEVLPANAFQSKGVRKRKNDEDDQDLGDDIGRKSWGSTVRMYPGSASAADADVEALLAQHRPVKREITDAAPSLKEEEGDADHPEKVAKQDDDWIQPGSTNCDTDAVIKQEECQTYTSPNDQIAAGSDAHPGQDVIFKKRKLKGVKRR